MIILEKLEKEGLKMKVVDREITDRLTEENWKK